MMEFDLDYINNPAIKVFYAVYSDTRKVTKDFYINLPAVNFDYRMVDTAERNRIVRGKVYNIF